MAKQYLAFDIGASGGRAILGAVINGKLQTREVHRFSNTPVTVGKHCYWDVLRLLHGIHTGLQNATVGDGYCSAAVDTWGVDYGLVDAAGVLLQNPMHYRDTRTQGMAKQVEQLVSAAEFYNINGLQQMEINTVYQLYADYTTRPWLKDATVAMLLMPDLFHFMLTGKQVTERSIASTTQLLDADTGGWSDTLIETLSLPRRIFTEIVPSGTVIGSLRDALCKQLSIPSAKITAVCGHDTQCAMAAIPASDADFIFLSCGTWALFGTELPRPLRTETARKYAVTNEIGYGGRASFLQNISGLWLIQETKRIYAQHGENYSYAQLEQLAQTADAFQSLINVDDPRFAASGDMPAAIRAYCKETGQPIPYSVGAVMRCIYESLALRFAKALSQIRECTGKAYCCIHMVGGGVKDHLLCQMTANACGIPVMAGPTEATVCGNLLIQMLADGSVQSLEEARRMVANSVTVTTYQPQQDYHAVWERYLALPCIQKNERNESI